MIAYCKYNYHINLHEAGGAKLYNKEKTDEWKLQQGNLLIETDASVDPEKAMYVCHASWI